MGRAACSVITDCPFEWGVASASLGGRKALSFLSAGKFKVKAKEVQSPATIVARALASMDWVAMDIVDIAKIIKPENKTEQQKGKGLGRFFTGFATGLANTLRPKSDEVKLFEQLTQDLQKLAQDLQSRYRERYDGRENREECSSCVIIIYGDDEPKPSLTVTLKQYLLQVTDGDGKNLNPQPTTYTTYTFPNDRMDFVRKVLEDYCSKCNAAMQDTKESLLYQALTRYKEINYPTDDRYKKLVKCLPGNKHYLDIDDTLLSSSIPCNTSIQDAPSPSQSTGGRGPRSKKSNSKSSVPLSKYLLKDLRSFARDAGVRGYSRMRKHELQRALRGKM